MAGTKGTPKKDRFLRALVATGTVTTAAEAAGVHRRTAYKWREADEEFAALWDEALEDAADKLEAEAIRRAYKGSDTLLIFLLKGLKPERYKERASYEHTGKLDHTHRPDLSRLTDKELETLEHILGRAAESAGGSD